MSCTKFVRRCLASVHTYTPLQLERAIGVIYARLERDGNIDHTFASLADKLLIP